jgi:hypothetical protein
MAGTFSPVVGAQPVEYQEETNGYATNLPAATDYNWFGIATSWSVEQGTESESITYLPEANASNKLEKRVNVKLRELYDGEITLHPQNNFDFLKYFTGEVGGTTDEVPSIQVGEINESDDTYRRLLGGMGEEVTVSIAEDEVVEVNGSFTFGEGNSFTLDDYIGDGFVAIGPVTPSSDEVSVQTTTIDSGTVWLYDGNKDILDSVPADSSTPQNTTEVAGSDVEYIQLTGAGNTVSSETITVYTDVDGGGTGSDADFNIEGTHADEDTTEPMSFDDLGSVTYGGSSLSGAIESIDLTISNELAVVRDANSALSTQIAAILPVDREITVEVEMTYDNFDFLEEVRSYTAKDFEFTIGNTTFTITGVKFPEMPYEFSADDLISDSISSDPCSSITWS